MNILTLVYGLACYAVFFLTFLYAVGFIGNLLVPRTIDAGGPAAATAVAAAIDVGLLALFGIQHSVMARQGFKKIWTRLVPVPAERSTYVLFSSLVLILLFWQWRPMPGVVWDVDNSSGRALLWALFAAGWLLVLVTTFLINHFDLFGLRQVWRHFRGLPPAHVAFREPSLYKVVRHPLYVGWLLAFWSIPTMTAGHLLFAAVATAYILVAIQFEEKDLMTFHPEYAGYRERVPMLIPRLRRRSGEGTK